MNKKQNPTGLCCNAGYQFCHNAVILLKFTIKVAFQPQACTSPPLGVLFRLHLPPPSVSKKSNPENNKARFPETFILEKD